MTPSTSGLIGGVVGFAFPTLLYLAASFALKRQHPTVSDRQRNASIIRMTLLADIPILTAIGYYIGQTYR
jgi:hypothetical protein